MFSAGSPCGQIWHGQGCPLFDVVHQALPLPTIMLTTLQRALKDGFGEAVMACDMPWEAIPLLRALFFFLNPFVNHVHVNERLTKDHASFKTAFHQFRSVP